MPKDVLRSNLTPAAKLVFATIAAELYGNETVEMTHGEIGACCHVGERQVRRSLQTLVGKGLVEQRRLSAGRIYQYRLLHAEFSVMSNLTPETAKVSNQPPSTIPACAKCRRPVKRLSRSGICRGCKTDLELAARVRALRMEMGAEASPEQIAERLKQITEQMGRRRLTARVRRVMEAVA